MESTNTTCDRHLGETRTFYGCELCALEKEKNEEIARLEESIREIESEVERLPGLSVGDHLALEGVWHAIERSRTHKSAKPPTSEGTEA